MAIGDIGERIRIARESFRGIGMKQTDLAQKIGVSSSRLSGWEKGKHDPHPISIVNKIAEALDVSAKWLTTGEPEVKGSSPMTPRTTSEPVGRIKLYGAIGADPTGNTSSIDFDEMEVPAQFARDDYGALVVEGDSMIPFLQPSDIVIFRDWHAEKPNHIMAAQLASGTWVVKLMVYEQGRFKLRSLNKKGGYADITEGFRVAGFLVGFVRDDGPERLIRLNPYGLKPDS